MKPPILTQLLVLAVATCVLSSCGALKPTAGAEARDSDERGIAIDLDYMAKAFGRQELAEPPGGLTADPTSSLFGSIPYYPFTATQPDRPTPPPEWELRPYATYPPPSDLLFDLIPGTTSSTVHLFVRSAACVAHGLDEAQLTLFGCGALTITYDTRIVSLADVDCPAWLEKDYTSSSSRTASLVEIATARHGGVEWYIPPDSPATQQPLSPSSGG